MTAKQTDSRPNLTDGAQRSRYDVRAENPGVGTHTTRGLEFGAAAWLHWEQNCAETGEGRAMPASLLA
jgi:hypothetical protein